MNAMEKYLKKHTEMLVKDVGIEAAGELIGKSKATIGRYYANNEEHADRFMPINAVASLEAAASFPHVSTALAELNGNKLSLGHENRPSEATVNSDIVALAQRFANLMGEYNLSIEDGVITATEAKRMLSETLELQKVLVDMKLHLESEAKDSKTF